MTQASDATLVIEVALDARTPADRQKLEAGLERLVARDERLRVSTDLESGQAILSGTSELELDRAVGWLINEAGVQLHVGAPQAACRESLGRRAEIDYTHKKQTGSTGQFARVKLVFEPGEPGSGFVFESKIVGSAVPRAYIPGVEKGIENAKDSGLLAGFPLIDFKATLIDGAYHDVDSSVLAFEIASRAAFKELRAKGDPKLLEPIMKVEVVTPEEFVHVLIVDLEGRQGELRDLQRGEAESCIFALAPLRNMFGYARDLDDITRRAGCFEMRFDHYRAVDIMDPPPDTFPATAAMRA